MLYTYREMQKIDVSTSTFVRFFLVVLAIGFLYYIRDILALLFVVIIIVAGLSPTVDRWAPRITRPGAVASVFLLIFLVATAIFSVLIPPIIAQLQHFTDNLPRYADILARTIQNGGLAGSFSDVLEKNISAITSRLGDLGGIIFDQALGVISGLVAVITIIVLTFYLLLETDSLKRIYRGFLPKSWHEELSIVTTKITNKLGAWIQGQLFLMICVGGATTLGLLIVGSPYALTLGLWAGLAGIVPMVGAIIGAVPGVAIGFASSPLDGLLALIVYVLVQQLENNVLVPKIMSKAVGLNPVVVIIAILIGSKLYGLTGVLLAVPLAAVISVVADEWDLIKETFSKPRRS